jgi:hypothetical protein
MLSCDSTNLTSVVASGPCAAPDAGVSSYLGRSGAVYVPSQGPGTCHVALTFATGFTYSADVTFATQPGGVCGGPQCKCGDYVVPAAGPLAVNNPDTTCVDAGVDAGGDSGLACPSGAIQGAPCTLPGTSCTGCRAGGQFACTCQEADASTLDGGGLEWQCLDTFHPCQ